MPGDFKGTVFQKNVMGGCLGGTVYKIYFLAIFKKNALCVYREYAKRGNNY